MNRFRKWLIRKLGGYTEPVQEIKFVRETYGTPINLVRETVISYNELDREDINKLIKPIDYDEFRGTNTAYANLQTILQENPNSMLSYRFKELDNIIRNDIADKLNDNSLIEKSLHRDGRGFILRYRVTIQQRSNWFGNYERLHYSIWLWQKEL